MAKRLSLPSWVALILLICLFSLAAHFFTESVGSEGLFSATSDIAGHFDDTFILVCFSLLPVCALLMTINPEETSFQQSFGQPPLNPPPNF